MMKMNAGTWIGLIGALIGFGAGIFAVIMTTGSMATWIVLVMVLIFCGMFYLFYRLFFKPMIDTNRLQKTGIPAKARVLEVRDTGVTINNNPQVKLVLEVKNSLGQKYTTQCRVLVSRINPGTYQAGMELPIRIDPKNEMNVVLDFNSANTSSAVTEQQNVAVLQGELEQLQKDNEAISRSGRPARAIIKKYNWLGAYVNGKNPYVELELEVLPDNSLSFTGRARGVIAESSISKYQPGCEIFVKYDLYDNSKVVIDHS
jgi:hypothetical protein